MANPRAAFLAVRSLKGFFLQNHHFFGELRELERPKPKARVELKNLSANRWQVQVCAESYAYFVKISVAALDVSLSDNYFALLPGESRAIEVFSPERKLSAGDFQVSWY